MRPDQNAPPPNEGINMLPGYSGDSGYNPEDMQPLTQSNVDFAPGQQGPGIVTNTFAPPPAQSFGGPEPGAPRAIPNYPQPGGGYPAPGTTDGWRGNAGNDSFSSFRDNATQEQPGFFQRLLDSITNGIGGVGDMFEHLHGPAQPRSSPMGMGVPGRGAFGMTSFQSHFPGSMIGPTSGLVSNPYNAGSGLSHSMTHTTAPTGYAATFSNVVKSRNIA